MIEMLITSILGGSALISSTLLFKILKDKEKSSQLEFPDLENEIVNLRLEYDRAKKFKKLTNEKEILEKAINEIYEEKTKPLDTSDFVNKIEENRKKLYFNIPTKEELQEGNIKARYKNQIDNFIRIYKSSPGLYLFKLPKDEHDTSGNIIREVIRSYDCIKEHSYYAFSYLNGSNGIETGAYYTLKIEFNGGSECTHQQK